MKPLLERLQEPRSHHQTDRTHSLPRVLDTTTCTIHGRLEPIDLWIGFWGENTLKMATPSVVLLLALVARRVDLGATLWPLPFALGE